MHTKMIWNYQTEYLGEITKWCADSESSNDEPLLTSNTRLVVESVRRTGDFDPALDRDRRAITYGEIVTGDPALQELIEALRAARIGSSGVEDQLNEN